jgi:hypothetical protein
MRVDPNETAPAAPDEDWAATADWTQFGSVFAAKQAMGRTLHEIDDKIAQVFLSEAGKACLDHLAARILRPPSWRMGDTLEHANFREGQKDVVRQLVECVNRAQARRAATSQPNPEPQA